jgi:hypothetical protein
VTAAIERKIPPQRLVTAFNPVVRAMAASPLHRLVDDAVVVLHVIGRRTGRHYDVPVGYVDLGDRLMIVTQHRWRVNLRGGARLELTHGGRRTTVRAELIERPEDVAGYLRAAIDGLGPQGAQRRLGLTWPAGRLPEPAEFEAAAREFDLAVVVVERPVPGEGAP